MRVLPLVGCAVSLVTAGATEVRAQPAHTTAAEAVFQEGRALMKEGRFAEACPKFELSARLERAAGTEANLAECYLRLGRTASAWLHYREAAALAQHNGAAERAAEARERAARLEPSLCRLVVRAEQPLPPGTVLRRDGEPLDLALLDKGVPVDPGQHVVEGRVREGPAVSRAVSIPAPGEGAACAETVIVLPPLPNPPPPKPPPPAAPIERASSGGPGKVLPLVLGGAGLVGLGIGAGFVIDAVAKRDSAECTSAGCSAAGLEERRSAGTSADIATVCLAAGGVLTGAALVLWFMAPGSKRAIARAAAP